MTIPEKRYDVTIGLTLPKGAQEAVQKRASVWNRITEGMESPKEHRVQVLTIHGATEGDLSKIRDAFDTVKKLPNFTAEAFAVRHVRGGADLRVGGSQEEDPFSHIEQTFREALQEKGVRGVEIKSDPVIPLVRHRDEKAAPPSLRLEYEMGKKIGWDSSGENFFMEEKPHESAKNSSSPALRSRQAGQTPQPRPDKPS